MRLLSTKTLEVIPISEDEVPTYAILSHAWEQDEVTLQDMQGFGVKLLSTVSRISFLKANQGLSKVFEAAKLAASDGYDWIWIDTCCIDKTSSAELSEAINSMYSWYQNSDVCYVYLSDAMAEVQGSTPSNDIMIRKSRWITRGWTLQELIAPRTVSFYSKEWSFIGKRNDENIMRSLARATGIDIGVLSGDIATLEVSVANRMRWASRRKTRRQEDIAYCLMGLFGVNMPLLYGEGAVRSFIRLQNQILQATDDQTLFAWSTPPGQNQATGLLAESPAYFRHVPSMYPISGWHQPENSIPWTMTNRGLMVQLYLRQSRPDSSMKEDSGDECLALLDCSAEIKRRDEIGREWIHEYSPAISLRRLWGDQYARVHAGSGLDYVSMRERQGGGVKTLFVKQDQSLSLPSFNVAERFLRGTGSFILSQVYPRDLWDSKSGVFRSGLSRQRCIQGLFRFSYPPSSGVSDGLFDVAVALQSTPSGQFEPFGILRPTEGRTVRQAYDHINKAWVSASRDGKFELAEEYRNTMVALLQLRGTQRLGGVSYALDLVARAELENTVSYQCVNHPALTSPAGLSIANGCKSAEEHLRLLFEPICISETSRLCRMMLLGKRIGVRSRNRLDHLEHDSAMPLSPLPTSKLPSTAKTPLGAVGLDPPPSPDGYWKFIRDEIHCDRPNAVDLNSVYNQNTAAVTEGGKISSVQAKESDHTDKLVQDTTSYDRLGHYAAFHGDPQIISRLIKHGFEGDAVTSTEIPILSILCNALNFRDFHSDSESEIDCTPNIISSLAKLLGAVRGTEDTALHYAATYSTREEFDRIMTSLFRAEEGLDSWDEFDVEHEWAYLFRLQNGNGETVLHRAAAMSNLEVVSYICERAPDAASQLDSMSRSTLFHAACGGDDRILHVIATALKSLSWAPTVDYPDENGLTPLHVACREGYSGCAEALLDLGASPLCATQSAGLTPIHYASLFGHLSCLQVMAQHSQARSDFIQVVSNARDENLASPIHLAAANGWLECVEMLVYHGSPLTPVTSVACIARISPSHSMSLPIDHTSRNSAEETEVLVQEIEKSTPKQIAERAGWEDVVQFLMLENALRNETGRDFYDREPIRRLKSSTSDSSFDS